MIPATHPNGDNQSEPVVLIANRDGSTRNWIEAVVRSSGMRAISCDSGSELLARLTDDTASCAILDLVLPDTSGLELQNALSEAGAAVVFVTRERCIASCAKAFKAGAVDFLTLPCDAIELVSALRRAVYTSLSSWTRRERLGELQSRLARLTRREREILTLVSDGLMNKQVADRLGISEITVQIHRGRVMRKMEARSFASLVRMSDALQASENVWSAARAHL